MEVTSVAVVGAGIMGSGIAQSLALAGYRVTAHDLDTEALTRFRDRIENGRFGLRRGVDIGKISAADADASLGRIQTTTDLAHACAQADLVVEAIFEDFGLKIQLFRSLDALVPARTILTSNTSGFSIAALAAATTRPTRVIGWHWSSPAPIMRFAEIIVHPQTADDVTNTVVEMARRVGKNPQIVKDDPLHWGFVANRVLMAAMREAHQVVLDGVASEDQVDILLKDCFRWPSGLFEMLRNTSRNWDADDQRANVGDTGRRLNMMPRKQ